MINLNSVIKKYLKVYLPIIVVIFILSAAFAFAACDPTTGKDSTTGLSCYTQLEPGAFAGFSTTTSTGNSLADFLGNVFNFGIAAAVVLALIMIIWGGIMYMTTDSWTGKEDGKTKIKDALYGLGLALISYLILYTINPCLVQFIPTASQACKTPNTFLKI